MYNHTRFCVNDFYSDYKLHNSPLKTIMRMYKHGTWDNFFCFHYTLLQNNVRKRKQLFVPNASIVDNNVVLCFRFIRNNYKYTQCRVTTVILDKVRKKKKKTNIKNSRLAAVRYKFKLRLEWIVFRSTVSNLDGLG